MAYAVTMYEWEDYMLSKQCLLCGKKTENMRLWLLWIMFLANKTIFFGTSIHMTKGTLYYIQSDVGDPSEISSKGEAHYLLTLIEVISTTCYFVNHLNNKQQQQQLSHLSQVFGVGYMNQKRFTSDRAHGSAFSTHSYQAICLTKTFSLYILSYYLHPCFLRSPLHSFNLP